MASRGPVPGRRYTAVSFEHVPLPGVGTEPRSPDSQLPMLFPLVLTPLPELRMEPRSPSSQSLFLPSQLCLLSILQTYNVAFVRCFKLLWECSALLLFDPIGLIGSKHFSFLLPPGVGFSPERAGGENRDSAKAGDPVL